MGNSEYKHPESGRVYREGDPAHHFALLVDALARECTQFVYHYEQRMQRRDYLDQHATWPSDPDRIARSMMETLTALDKAYTRVTYDRDAYRYGLGKQDDEWHRKYGDIPRD